MKYLLSDLTITENEVDYILDLIKVNFVLNVNQFPQLDIGVHKRLETFNKNIILDIISSDISNFIGHLSKQGIVLNLVDISTEENSVIITLKYKEEIINFTLE